MSEANRVNDAVHWFMNDLSSRVVADSGIPTDRYHLGKLIYQSFKDAPDFVMQINGGTGESETNMSALKRTTQCAIALRNLGLKQGDVMVLMAPNHIDIAVPFYAALYLGVIIAAVDKNLGVNELQGSFDISRPKVVFCQSEKASDIQLALNKLDLNTHIVTFDKGDYLLNFTDFLNKCDVIKEFQDFKPTDFDPENTIAFLVATSGTTGFPKAAAITHKNIAISNPYLWVRQFNFPTPTRLLMVGSPLQWLTAIVNFVLSPILRYTRLQTSLTVTWEHAYYLINEYKPTYTILSPTFMTTLIKPGDREQCDFSCFENICLGGSHVPRELIDEIKRIMPHTEVLNIYGMSELSCIGFVADFSSPESCGKPLGCFRYRLIDPDTQRDILKPHVPGELWVKGPGIFKEYYNNPEATKEAFSEDGWFKTGDIFYRDQFWDFFYVERIKLLLKYKSHQHGEYDQIFPETYARFSGDFLDRPLLSSVVKLPDMISPGEVENVIRQHPAVLDVAITGIPDPECGDLPVACVVTRPGQAVTAQDIKDLVKNSLSDSKQLRGGVIFVDEIPMTASTKVHRRKLKEMVLVMNRQ